MQTGQKRLIINAVCEILAQLSRIGRDCQLNSLDRLLDAKNVRADMPYLYLDTVVAGIVSDCYNKDDGWLQYRMRPGVLDIIRRLQFYY